MNFKSQSPMSAIKISGLRVSKLLTLVAPVVKSFPLLWLTQLSEAVSTH